MSRLVTAFLAVSTMIAPANAQPHAEPRLPRPPIAAAFPFSQRFVSVGGVSIAYVDSGQGRPIVFLHGNPTSAYLWRNVLPFVQAQGRVIAPDLPGMGRSGRPDPAPGFLEHVTLFERLADTLGLDDMVLVGHDWGAAIAFEYARRHASRVTGIVFMEGVLPPIFPQPSFEAMGPEMGQMFRALKDPVQGRTLVIDQNLFIEQVLPGFVNRPLTPEEMARYRSPFSSPADRAMMLRWPREIPIAGDPADVSDAMKRIQTFMERSRLPMLLVYAEPGVLVPPSLVPWYQARIARLETAYVGQGLHFIQEDEPAAIGRALSDWLRRHPVGPEVRTTTRRGGAR